MSTYCSVRQMRFGQVGRRGSEKEGESPGKWSGVIGQQQGKVAGLKLSCLIQNQLWGTSSRTCRTKHRIVRHVASVLGGEARKPSGGLDKTGAASGAGEPIRHSRPIPSSRI